LAVGETINGKMLNIFARTRNIARVPRIVKYFDTLVSSGITELTILLIISTIISPAVGLNLRIKNAATMMITIMTHVETTVSVIGNPKRYKITCGAIASIINPLF